MGLFTSEYYEDLRELMVHQIKDLYDSEKRVVIVLPKAIKKANSLMLKQTFDTLLCESYSHIAILESIFALINVKAERETCEACAGMLMDTQEMLEAKGAPHVIDTGLILAIQRVVHYEISGYGGSSILAKQVREHDVACLLTKIVDELISADLRLTRIAETSIHQDVAEIQAST